MAFLGQKTAKHTVFATDPLASLGENFLWPKIQYIEPIHLEKTLNQWRPVPQLQWLRQLKLSAATEINVGCGRAWATGACVAAH